MPTRPNAISGGILTFVGLITSIGPYLADFNETHVYNPLWPGHARFHNGQTMSLGLCLGLATLYKTWWANDDDLLMASFLGSVYYVAGISAFFYPGSTAWDPPQFSSLSFPQFVLFGPATGLCGLAYWLERSRSGSSKRKTI